MKSLLGFWGTFGGVSRPVGASLALASFAVLSMSACAVDNPNGQAGDKIFGGQTGDEFDKTIQRLDGDVERRDIEGPAIGQASEELSQFAWKFYTASSSPDENFVYSPYSLTTAASMLYAGGARSTQSQMGDVFEFSEETAEFHQARNDLMQYLLARNIEATEERNAQVLKVSNDFWMAERLKPKQSFLDTLSEFYGAPAYLFEGTPEDVRLAINSKVASDTESLIDELLPPESIQEDTVFVMTNALYFKARWQWEFLKDETEKADFQLQGGTMAQVDMMHASPFGQRYSEQDGLEVLAMRYFGSELEFVAMMPAAGDFETFSSGLTAEKVQELTSALIQQQVDLRFPQLDLDTNVPLKDELISLGMTDAFDDTLANLQPMTEGNVWLGNAFHQTRLILNEEGTEAASATAFIGIDEAEPPPPIEVTFDRPFVFMIRDIETQAVLFVGHFSNPE